MSHLKFPHRLALLLGVLVLSPVVWAGAPQAYITNFNDNTVSVIDTDTNRVMATVPVGSFPNGVAGTPDGARVYVANQGDGTVSVIDTARIDTASNGVETVTVGGGPVGVAVTPDGAHVYVGNFSGSTVSVIDTATNGVIKTVTVGQSPEGVAGTPPGTPFSGSEVQRTPGTLVSTPSNNPAQTAARASMTAVGEWDPDLGEGNI